MSVIYNTEDDCYYFKCPHCDMLISVKRNDIACGIFRHGSYKSNGKQLPPHLPKKDCDHLSDNNLIYGCGKPFRFDGKQVSVCDYI